jgi:hypothetical protein
MTGFARVSRSEGPMRRRRQRTPITRDVLTPVDALIVARRRAQTILTLLVQADRKEKAL